MTKKININATTTTYDRNKWFLDKVIYYPLFVLYRLVKLSYEGGGCQRQLMAHSSWLMAIKISVKF